MSPSIVELSTDELVDDDADRTNELLRVRAAHGPSRLVPAPRPKLLSLALPPVIVEVPEHEDVESAAKTLELRRPSSSAAVVAAIAIPPEPETQPELLDLPDDDLLDGSQELPLAAFFATPEPEAGPYPSVAPAAIELTQDRMRGYRAPVSGMWVAMGVVSVCGIIGVLAGALSFYRHSETRSTATTSMAPTPTVAIAIPAVTPSPLRDEPKVDTKPSIDVNALPSVGTPAPKAVVIPASRPVATAAATAKTSATTATATAPETKASTKAAPETKAAIETGTLRTFSSAAGKSVTVDGKTVGTAGAPIAVACGHHSIAIGDARARDYDVPCNSVITVGTP